MPSYSRAEVKAIREAYDSMMAGGAGPRLLQYGTVVWTVVKAPVKVPPVGLRPGSVRANIDTQDFVFEIRHYGPGGRTRIIYGRPAGGVTWVTIGAV